MVAQLEVSELLHGVLDVTVFEANHIHHCFHAFIIEATERIAEALHYDSGHTKLYATVDIGAARVARTREVKFHHNNPRWNESFRIYCAHSSPSIVVSVKNQHIVGAKILGRAKIPTSKLRDGEPLQGWFDLLDEDGCYLKAQIHVLLKFSHVSSDPCWNTGLSQFDGVSNSYFPLRTGCHVTLYQNSHLSDHFQPAIYLFDGREYRPSRLWEELYVAITEAEHFIYVAGWSVNTGIVLVRDPERMIAGAEGVTIGELLMRKAEEGVTVLVMVWQDRTSFSFLGNAGLMNTHDEATCKYFQGSKVKCFLCPRHADRYLTAFQHVEVDAEFTHHQKTVSLDAPAGDGARKVVSFLGGIDISDGRYDDENHTLFRKLDTVYADDFQQKNFGRDADLQHGGPREPWHDVHSRLEGGAAWDVVTNFEQRWIKQAPNELADCLLSIKDHPLILHPASELEAGDSWSVQVFRSIDDSSVVGFPSDPSEAAEMGLVSEKGITIDQSIHSGYIEAIRRARRFIYIENQYFFGGSSSWTNDRECGCSNLVPIEIALKIASKIRNGERFAVYVVTPMWPEGTPESETVQAILHWNRLTMEMMYGIVAEAIEEAGLGGEVHPCDYLNFFCLGNREVEYAGEYVPPEQPEIDTDYWRAQTNRRFLIYVHAKLMIVDDEYVVVGSANLNQRSLAGNRDSEIAHGSFQPAHIDGCRGDVHGFRMSLWHEHFMSHCEHPSSAFLEPESLECVRKVREVAERLWEMFVGDEVVDLPGHLLPFPVAVSESGEVSDLPADGLFPGTNAPVRGKKSEILPLILTT
ncbi:phospholipase D alpha 1-like [Canna indica]|uniref:Phospholipase D n=1 Tax=Canna indica TaxID=4628 RepID=A0AAQ3JTA1_9LILI|nr:phospholipase D alpha 1-like [Canna indica]